VTNPALTKYAYDFFLNVWAQTPVVDTTLIQQAFQEAAAKAHTTAPPDVSKYIDATLAANP